MIIIYSLYGALQLVSNLIAWTQPAEGQAKLQFIKLVSYRVWLIATPVLTILLISLIVRAVFKLVDGFNMNLNATNARLRDLTNEIAALRFPRTPAMLPDIMCDVEEVHLYGKPKGSADMFVRLRLENRSNQPAMIEGYSAILEVKGKPRRGYFQDDLHLYVMTQNKCSTDEYGVDEWFPIPIATEPLPDLSERK